MFLISFISLLLLDNPSRCAPHIKVFQAVSEQVGVRRDRLLLLFVICICCAASIVQLATVQAAGVVVVRDFNQLGEGGRERALRVVKCHHFYGQTSTHGDLVKIIVAIISMIGSANIFLDKVRVIVVLVIFILCCHSLLFFFFLLWLLKLAWMQI